MKCIEKKNVVLDYSDLKTQDIIPTFLIKEKERLISKIINYLYYDEEKHFKELDEPKDHIFLKLKRLKDLNG